MKNAIITEFNEDRSFWMAMIQQEVGMSRLSVADFTKQVMTEMVGEKGIAIYAQNEDLEMTIKKIATSVRVNTISGAKYGNQLEAERQSRKELYNIIK